MKEIIIEKYDKLTKSDVIKRAISDADIIKSYDDEKFENSFMNINKMIDYLQTIKEEIRDKMISILDDNNKKITKDNYSISSINGGERLDYDSDPEYYRYSSFIQSRKKLIDAANKSKHIVVDNNGEVVNKVPVKSINSDKIVIKY